MSQWQLPPQGMTKLNVDGPVFHAEGSVGVGLIIRDWEGKVLMPVNKKEVAAMEPLEIELIAILRGLQFYIPLGLQSLCIESDSLLLVQEITSSDISNSIYENVVIDIQQLKSKFRSCSIVHINREANEFAHKLARFSRNVIATNVWWDYVPSCVQQVLWTDYYGAS
ncbi:hypothetical protein F2P56_034045 [Juglans regia]|uniref:RNase H type-1 domain-containing protein n=2 Tax=Juglans regia TaxID=51240 RepID=A0A833WTX7_JUGRE|nr:uncharacterized protein LOC108979547 [Juglans regia]KAF5444954.1 hypothetical protein F2P56_034045 [Juglans regia]